MTTDFFKFIICKLFTIVCNFSFFKLLLNSFYYSTYLSFIYLFLITLLNKFSSSNQLLQVHTFSFHIYNYCNFRSFSCYIFTFFFISHFFSYHLFNYRLILFFLLFINMSLTHLCYNLYYF